MSGPSGRGRPILCDLTKARCSEMPVFAPALGNERAVAGGCGIQAFVPGVWPRACGSSLKVLLPVVREDWAWGGRVQELG